MQVYFGERVHFYQVSANSEEAWRETKRRPDEAERGGGGGEGFSFLPSSHSPQPLFLSQ